MNHNLFQTMPLAGRSLLQRWFRQYPDENAVIELNNLLATVPLRNISKQDIEAIEQKYGIGLSKEFSLNLEEFYAVYLNHAAADLVLSDEETTVLQHLQHILSLSTDTVQELHVQVGKIIYAKALEAAVGKGHITDGERRAMAAFEKVMRLPVAFVEGIDGRIKQAFVHNMIGDFLKQEQYSPDDERRLQNACHHLGVPLQLKENTRWQLERLKTYWTLEHEPLRSISADIVLQKNEQCYWMAQRVRWYELRTVKRRTSSVGYSARIKVAKGFYLNTSRYTPGAYTTQEMQLMESGSLYLTNKRVLLIGNNGSTKNIRLDKILMARPYKDGVEIIKEEGKTPLLEIKKDADLFTLILARLISGL